MRGIDHARAFRDLVQFIDEDRALLCEVVHYVAVVNNLLAHVDRCAEGIERNLHDVDRANHARAKASRLEEKNSLCRCFGVG